MRVCRMRSHLLFYCMLAAAALAPSVVGAADLAQGKKKAAMCAVCHGLDGLSKNPEAPNLAGDNANYLVKQLKAFQSGARQNEQMSIVAASLSDEDVTDLAAWYSSLKVTVELPQ
jgi:cytochrome c553